ncbi:MAG: hybrid sensor histidine kinase/response regulator, partial [Rhizobiaceae bacterium]|nr:hybrid sensor histidine kinase/response regulator [Rhizobiaceae bacterium]
MTSVIVPLLIAPAIAYFTGRMWLHMIALKEVSEKAVLLERKASQKLHEMLKKQQLVFSVIGHELRTPATSIKMMLDEPGYLRSGKNLEVVRRTADHLISVLDDMRALANPNLEITGVSGVARLSELLKNAVESQGVMITKQGLAVEFDLTSEFDEYYEFNKQLLRQVVINLVRNCLLHSKASTLNIVGRCQSIEPHTFQVRFSDDGMGIPKEAQSQIFERYQRLNKEREGLGLGLNICREFLRRHLAGDLCYEESQGGGATFVVTFEAAEAVGGFTGAELPKYDFAGKRILVVEDNASIRELTALRFRKLRAEVDTAEDGKEGIKMAVGGRYDLIIVDLFMPNMQGDQMVRQLRGSQIWVPTVGVTATTV